MNFNFREAAAHLTFPVDLSHCDGFGKGYYRTLLGAMALQSNKTAHFHGIEGFPNITLDDLMTKVEQILPSLTTVTQEHTLIRKSYTNQVSAAFDYDGDTPGDSFRIWDEGYIHFDHFNDGSIKISIGCLDVDLLKKIMESLDPLLNGGTDKAKISVIATSSHGPSIMNVGEGGTPLVRDNYMPEALAVFDHVVQDLGSANPCGRLAIFTGLYGCGKTYFLEGLIAAQKNCRFILLPASLIQNVDAPDLLRVLLPDEDSSPGRNRNSGGQVTSSRIPTVLIIEEADHALISRQLDNLGAISTILNLADGILGRALDIRILATSNAKVKDVDKALLRDGRLCRSYDFKPLPAEQAQAVYRRELGKALGCDETGAEPSKYRTITKDTTLAEVYRAVKDDTK